MWLILVERSLLNETIYKNFHNNFIGDQKCFVNMVTFSNTRYTLNKANINEYFQLRLL